MIVWHNHHIIPKHMGGTDHASNIVRVNVAMHAFLHKCLYEEHGFWQDRVAYQGLAGIITHEQAVNEVCSMANKGRNFSKEHREKIAAGNRRRKLSNTTKAKIGKASASRRHSDTTKAKIGQALKGSKKGPYKTSITETFTFVNTKMGATEIMTPYELRIKYGLDPVMISRLIKGKAASHRGWFVMHTKTGTS